jgi:inner membrane protein
MMIWQTWWAWAIAAVLIGIVEVIVPGYIFLGFAAGAAVVALLLLVGGPLAAFLTPSLPLLMLFFATASVVAWYAMRRLAGLRRGQIKHWDRDINEN